MDEIENARYIALTTFKRDGTPRSTPVWVTGSDGGYLFYTGAESWKARRIRSNPAVEVRVCDRRGRVEPHVDVYVGTAELCSDSASIAAAVDAVAEKYGWQGSLVKLTDRVKARLGRGETPVAVRLTIARDPGS